MVEQYIALPFFNETILQNSGHVFFEIIPKKNAKGRFFGAENKPYVIHHHLGLKKSYHLSSASWRWILASPSHAEFFPTPRDRGVSTRIGRTLGWAKKLSIGQASPERLREGHEQKTWKDLTFASQAGSRSWWHLKPGNCWSKSSCQVEPS